MRMDRVSRWRERSRNRIGIWIAIALIASGCETLEHGRGAKEFANRNLSTASSEGQERLRIEAKYDTAIQALIARLGNPDYIHIISREELYLFYIEKDTVARVTRTMIPPGEVEIFERTPGFLLKMLPEKEINAVLAKRKKREQARRSNAPRSTGTRPAPAARAPASPTNLIGFDSRSIVMRLRTPLTAADPGVTEWRWGRRSNGDPAQIADHGTTRYQVGSESVTVATRIAANGQRTPESARLAIHRLNRAVFGTRANLVDQHARGLADKVAADPSGQTRLTKRVAGRTVLVSRDTNRGFLIYSISSR